MLKGAPVILAAHWNTGAHYTVRGQRIYAALNSEGFIGMLDVDRGIQYGFHAAAFMFDHSENAFRKYVDTMYLNNKGEYLYLENETELRRLFAI